MMFKLAIVLLASLQAIQAFTCPDDSHTFYHADVSTGCTVYHRCENSRLETLTCPTGQAFNHETSTCQDASTVNCYETMGHHAHHHHKRSVEDVHTIDIQEVKGKLIDAYRSLKPVLEEIVKDMAPTIYEKFEKDYLPGIRNTKKDVMPFFKEKVYPQITKWTQYLLRLTGKLFEKTYQSYELSNSTHIAVVSMSDIAEEVSNDLKPVLELGKYMSARMMPNNQHVRQKRQVSGGPSDLILGLISPFVNDMAMSFSRTFFGDGEGLASKVIFPSLYEILGDPESRYDLFNVLLSAKSCFTPLAWEMLSRQTYNTPAGTVIQIPRYLVQNAWNKFMKDAKPTIRKLTMKHLPSVLRLASNNVPAILDSVDRLKVASSRHSGVLRDAILNFVSKHGKMLRTSTSTHMNFYSLTEIMEDLVPIKMSFFHVLVDYFRQNKDSFANVLFGQNSFLQRELGPAPVYAQPRPPVSGPSIAKAMKYLKKLPPKY